MIIKENLKETITSPEDIARVLQNVLSCEDLVDRDKEHFWAIGLDGASRVKYIELVTLGILTESLTHPREFFRLAVMKGVYSVMAAHNHPSGNLKPSGADIKQTKSLNKAGELIGIKLLDHLVISSDGYSSFKNLGYL